MQNILNNSATQLENIGLALIESGHDSLWASTWENLSSVACEQQRRRPACASTQTD